MTVSTQGRSGRLARLIIGAMLGAALSLSIVAVASAAEAPLTPVQQLQQGPVISFSCVACHAEISDTKLPNIKFSHASHISYECRACHPRFPHQRTNLKVTPGMKECWNCHALRHGPQGVMAQYDCAKCHTDYTKRAEPRRPKSHTADWAKTPHVAPSRTKLSTECMMCHTKASCDDCHRKAEVSWDTTQSYTYNAGKGCLACHGADLPRLAAPVSASGLDASPHRLTDCGACHPDFRYDDAKAKTKLWDVNAGLACAECHEQPLKELPKSTAAADWKSSIHGQKVLTGEKLGSATCSGCHGGHDIERLKTDAAKRRLQLSGTSMCLGSCHEHSAAVTSYNDWWHGAAYKRGSLDAPACWDCHGAHKVLANKDPKSAVHPENLHTSCQNEGACHVGTSEDWAEGWRKLPHGSVKMKDDNPLTRVRATVFGSGE